MEKHVNTILLAVIVLLLGAITYSTGQGRLFPAKQPRHLTCDSLMTQRLFYSDFFGSKEADDGDLASQAKAASSIDELRKIINNNTKFDANSAEFYTSLTVPGSCQAHISLKKADDDGTTSIYLPYSISGYAPSTTDEAGDDLIENIQMNLLDISKDKS